LTKHLFLPIITLILHIKGGPAQNMDAVDSDADPDGDNHTICFYFYDT